MSLLSRILGYATREEAAGARLDDPAPWIVDAGKNPAKFLRAVALIFPEDHFLYLEGATQRSFAEWLVGHTIAPPLKIAYGTIWPKPDFYHIPCALAEEAAELVETQAIAIPVIHIHVHDGVRVVLEWHDAFGDDPMYIDSAIAEERIEAFAAALGTRYRRTPQ